MDYKLKDGTFVQIREVKVTDASVILDFFRAVTNETKNLMREPHEFNMTVEDEIKFLENNIDSKDNFMGIAISEGKCISTAGFHGSALQRVNHRVSMGISVLKDFHGKGLGSLMMDYILEQAKAYGKQKMELEVRIDNLNAIHLYQKHGFTQEGLISKGFFVDNSYVDLIIMAKYL